MTLDKQYHGDLEATGKGQMLTAGSAAKAPAATLPSKRSRGTLTAAPAASSCNTAGTMTRGVPQLTITVVPESGTGQLAGIAGKMTIKIAADGKHSYDFEYTLPTH